MIGIKKILKGLLIREENTLTPKEIEILPGGTAGTKTTLVSSQTSNLTLTLPSTAGTNGQLLQTDGAGNLSFVTAGSTNTTLSNLTAPTAINQDLIFNKSTPILKTADTVSAQSESLSVLTGTATVSNSSGSLTLSTGISVSSSGTILLATGNTTASAATTGAVTIRSGNATTGVASSGPVTITTGTSIGTAITGALTLQTGSSVGLAGSGIVTINSGNVTTNTSGASGQVSISSGTSVAGATGLTGAVFLASGNHASPSVSTGTATVTTGTQTGTAFSGTGGVTTITTGNITSGTATGFTGATNILSGNANGSGGTGAVTLRSGNATGTNGASGNVILQTGSVVSGARGTVNIVDASLATAQPGHVWTVSNTTTGAGNWQAPQANAAQNFIINGSIDNATASIFVPYNDSSTTRPVDGIGGTSTLTTSLTTTTPINGSKSVLLTKPASNCQGQGWSISDITIPLEFRGKPLRHYLAYLVNSGTFVAGANGSSPTDGDLIAYFYDQTNNKLVESTNIKFFASSTTIVDDQSGEIQFDSNCTTVRMIVHVASTSTAAFELKVDSVRLSNQLSNSGALQTNYFSVTAPTITGNTSGTYNPGTGSVYTCEVSLQGQEIIAKYYIDVGTGATEPVGAYQFAFPSGYVPDSSIQSFENLGYGSIQTVGATPIARIALQKFGSVMLVMKTDGALLVPGDGLMSNSNHIVSFTIRYKVQGQNASVKLSEPGDTRPFSVSLGLTTGQNILSATPTKINFDSIWANTHGTVDTVNKRIGVTSGKRYRIHGQLNIAATSVIYTGGVQLRVNGTTVKVQTNGKSGTGGTESSVSFDFKQELKAQDYVEIWFEQGSGSTISVRGDASAPQLSVLHMEEDSSGSQQFAANELIAVSAANTNAQSFPHNTRTLINWNAESIDIHGGLSGTTYTAYVAQVVEVSMQIGVAGLGNGTQFTLVPAVTHTGTVVDERYFEMQGTTTTAFTSYPTAPVTSQIFRMKAGDTITASLYHFNSIGTAVTSFNANRTYLNIKRIG